MPTAMKILRGNPGKRALNKHEPQPPAGADMPDWLSAEAKAHWPLVAAQLKAAGVLTQMDAPALALYCEAFARWKDANENVAKYGPVIKAPSGVPMQSPYLHIANKAWAQMLKTLVEFGMTPSSRSKVTVSKPPESAGEFDEFITH